MRMTTLGIASRAAERLTSRYEGLASATDAVTTGRRINRPSDDPASMRRVMALTADERSRQQELREVDDAAAWLSKADSTLQSVLNRFQRARSLVVSGSNTLPADQRASIAAELRSVGHDLLALANSQHHGRPLFGGNTAGPAVDTSSGYTYGGDAGAVLRRVGPGHVVQVNVTAQDAFWFPPPSGYPGDAFSLIDDLADAIESGDVSRAAGGLDALEVAVDQVTVQLGAVGARANQVDAARSRTSDLAQQLANERSALEDVDIGQAVLQLRTEETAYQTALAAIGRSFPPSLAAFLQ